MAKKKKALKPVARGFATVSVPKKPLSSEEPQDTAGTGDAPGAQNSDAPVASVAPPQTDQAALEEGVLQAIVDKLQDKTEKDVVRNVKVW
jgi:ATP-dependent RNA helicase DHX29